MRRLKWSPKIIQGWDGLWFDFDFFYELKRCALVGFYSFLISDDLIEPLEKQHWYLLICGFFWTRDDLSKVWRKLVYWNRNEVFLLDSRIFPFQTLLFFLLRSYRLTFEEISVLFFLDKVEAQRMHIQDIDEIKFCKESRPS